MKLALTNLDAQRPFSCDFEDSMGEMLRILIPPLGTVFYDNIDPFYLNQDKNLRNEIFAWGKISFTWIPEPDDMVGLPLPGSAGGFNRTDQPLTATGDPRVFTTPEAFVHLPGIDPIHPQFSIEVFHNGKREMQTKTTNPADGDYFVEESGGPGTGFDTVHFLTFTPKPSSKLRVNYQSA
jgi:hypothetical protein